MRGEFPSDKGKPSKLSTRGVPLNDPPRAKRVVLRRAPGGRPSAFVPLADGRPLGAPARSLGLGATQPIARAQPEAAPGPALRAAGAGVAALALLAGRPAAAKKQAPGRDANRSRTESLGCRRA